MSFDRLPEPPLAVPPPWILGHRGAPREAPENTLASLRRALELRLDGVEYDVRTCASGEAIVIHDDRLERTTDGRGEVAHHTLPELASLDAGGWFDRRFRGEPLPLLHEALALGPRALHMVELKEPALVVAVAEALEELVPRPAVRVASFLREVVLEATDHGLPAMLLAVRATEDDRRFVRDRRIAAHGVGPGGWRSEAGVADWSFCEQWSWAVDDPEELLELCRRPVFGLNTNEPLRALAARELCALVPGGTPAWPLEVGELEVRPESLDEETRARGEWFGRWRPRVVLSNPLPVVVEARLGFFARGGAFEVAGLPERAVNLAPGASTELRLELSGGGRSPGPDPLLGLELRFPDPVRGEPRRLLLDAPLRRVRRAVADGLARRLPLLAERAGEVAASVTIRRQGTWLLLSVENPGDLEDPHLVAHLDGVTVRAGRGLRLELPEDFDRRPGGVPFSCGIEGRRAGLPGLRRFAGGVPEGLENGPAGRLVPGAPA